MYKCKKKSRLGSRKGVKGFLTDYYKNLGICTCSKYDDIDSVSRESWQRRLWYTGIDNSTRQNMIALENEFVDEHSKKSKSFVESLINDHENHGRITGEDIAKAMVKGLEEFSDENKKQLNFYLDRIHNTGRVRALERAGLSKKAARKKIAAAADERRESVLQSIDLAFKSITSLPDRVVEQLRDELRQGINTGGSTQEVLRNLLQNQIEDLDLEQEADLREALDRIWGRTRNDLQRVIRTETVNAYSRVQLQEWFNQGIKKVSRHSIDDDRTCAVCRSLSAPPDNVYDIVELLALDYPVTQDPATGEWISHPNCRCWFEPMVEDVWAELEDMEADLFGDINRKGTVALNVPADDRDHVEPMLREMDESISMNFVSKIEDLPEWREWRLDKLRGEMGSDVAEMVLEEEILLNGNTEWTDPQTEIHYIARDARKSDHITMPMARAQAKIKFDKYDMKFVVDRFLEKKSEMGMTLEEDGIEIFGGEPFISPPASNSPKDYFIEAYAYYIVNPTILKQIDREMYEWLNNEIFHGREYIMRGGIK